MSQPPQGTQDIIQQEALYIGKTFNRYPVVWARGEGARLFDREGKAYLDFFSGHAVMNLGHRHPGQLAAMQAQMNQLVHTGNLYYLEPQVALARALVENTFGDKVFFANSGAEIVELSLKLARKWARRPGGAEDRYEILTLRGSFHGRTYGALSATGQEKYHQGLAPMLPGFVHVPWGDTAAAAAAVTPRTCAILVEPVQGEGGVRPALRAYLDELRALCQKHGLLLIFDEIQCGLGRCGTFNAYEAFDVIPDALLLGKPLGGGLPLSALVTRADVASALGIGDHGSTFGGNPVAAAGGLVLLETLRSPAFLLHVRETGAYFQERLAALARQYPTSISAVRGLGLMWGLEVVAHGPAMVQQALDLGLVINCTAGQVLRFLPPLTIGRAEVDEAMEILERIFYSGLRNH